LVLNLCLEIANLVSKLHLEPDGLATSSARECFHGNLHAIITRTTEVQGRMMLNLVKTKLALVIKSAAVKDEPLLVLYLCLDCIRWLYLNGDLSCRRR
jgi:hypothetical protein